MEFQNILLLEDSILIYNEKECQIYSMSGAEKYRGTFAKNVSLVVPTQKKNRFILVTTDSIDTIELN